MASEPASISRRASNDEADVEPRLSPYMNTGRSLPSKLYEIIGLGWSFLPEALHPFAAIDIYFPGFTRIFSSTAMFRTTDIPDLGGKVVLVTGGNNGLGKETILQLAKHHPHKIFMAARSESKAVEAIKSINAQLKHQVAIEHVPLDLMSLASVKTAAQHVISKSDRLDILVLNAGIMATPPATTQDGFDDQLGTNHVGHFLLTRLLLPRLQETSDKTGDVRVVSVSSEAWHFGPHFDTITSPEKLCKSSPWTRYGASKAANILFAAELARRYPKITSTAIHPGIIMTDLYGPSQKSNSIIDWGMRLANPFIAKDVPDGALNQLWCAAGARKDQLHNGGYYTPVAKLKLGNKYAKNEDWGRRLWDWTEQELAKRGY